jgi:hypothetical protein
LNNWWMGQYFFYCSIYGMMVADGYILAVTRSFIGLLIIGRLYLLLILSWIFRLMCLDVGIFYLICVGLFIWES